MINTVKKLLNVTFQSKARLCEVFTYFTRHTLKYAHPFMVTLPNTTRKRSWNEGGFKQYTQYAKNCMMHDSISYGRFMYMTHLRIADIKVKIWSMLVFLFFQVSM